MITPTTRTVKDVVTHVKRQFGDEAGVQINDRDIIRWINDAQIDINARNKMLKARGNADVVAGQSEYTLSSLDVQQLESIRVADQFLTHKNLTEADPGALSKSPNAEADVPSFWWVWAGVINLWPRPSKDIPNGLTIFYTKMPTPVETSNDLLSLPDKYYGRVVDYVLARAYELDEDLNSASYMEERLAMRLEEQSEEERRGQSMTYPTISFVED